MENYPLSDEDFESLMASHREECLRIALEMLGLQSDKGLARKMNRYRRLPLRRECQNGNLFVFRESRLNRLGFVDFDFGHGNISCSSNPTTGLPLCQV